MLHVVWNPDWRLMPKNANTPLGKKAAIIALLAACFMIAPQAAHAATASCGPTDETCAVSRTATGTVIVKTFTSNSTSGNTAYYSVHKGTTSGPVACSGQIKYNGSASCNVGSYNGKVTFKFYKGQNTYTTVSI